MKIKYAIYKNDVGLRAVEYADTKEAIKYIPYISEEDLPVIINRRGGYTNFKLEYENEKGFQKIIEVNEDDDPLTCEQMYPKNSSSFEYGWISPDGDTYNTGLEGHVYAAEAICKELGIDSYNEERKLEELKWAKVTAMYRKGILEKKVFIEGHHFTKAQAETMFELGLWELDDVKFLVECSQEKW